MNSPRVCVKCKNTRFYSDKVGMTGSFFSRFFNIQNKQFTAVTCTKCQHTEFYRGESSTLGNIADFFGN